MKKLKAELVKATIVVGIITLILMGINMASCTDPVDRQPPFDYDLTDTTATIYKPPSGAMAYYSPEIFPIGWGEYEWDQFNQGAFCLDSSGYKTLTIVFDERTIIRVVTSEWDYITTINELKQNKL